MRIATLAGLGAVCVATAAIAGCGGGSSTPTTGQPAATAQHPAQTAGASSLDTGGGRSHHSGTQRALGTPGYTQPSGTKPKGAKAQQPVITRGHGVQRGRSTPTQSGDDHNPVRAAGPNPCRLVSVAEAKAITGGAISSSVEAPLGPTCVYQTAGSKKTAGSKTTITVAVESGSFAHAASHMSKRAELTVHGRRAYCGRLGTQMLLVPLAHGQLLHVIAPCSVAQQFAALALGRLAA